MKKKILKVNAWLLTIVGSVVMLFFIISMLATILMPSAPNSWDDLGKGLIAIGTLIGCVLSIPLIISGVGTLRYLKGKNNTYVLCIISNIIGIILFSLAIYFFIYQDILNVFSDYVTGEIYINLKIIMSAIIFFIFIAPSIISIVELYKDKKNLTFKITRKFYIFLVIVIIAIILAIVGYNLYKESLIDKIEITEDNKYSYSDFKSQLESRNLIYELPEDKKELTSQKQIIALDSDSKYGYTFSSGSYTDSYMLSVDTKRKFPMFVYNSYTSLIKKSDKTASYYYIGPEDWYINWYIYYVDGKIYAAIGEESEYGKSWETSLSTTEYGVVVSEEDDITIYNSKKNYYVKGGGILDTKSGAQRTNIPTTTDIYNDKCMKIRVVDEVNAETLDEIAKELSPQYWKIYKSSK